MNQFIQELDDSLTKRGRKIKFQLISRHQREKGKFLEERFDANYESIKGEKQNKSKMLKKKKEEEIKPLISESIGMMTCL